jgi:hypothetical protein
MTPQNLIGTNLNESTVKQMNIFCKKLKFKTGSTEGLTQQIPKDKIGSWL